VILDIGTNVTENIARLFGRGFTRIGPQSPEASEHTSVIPSTPAELLAQDTLFAKIATERGALQAYDTMLGDSARALRAGVGPIIGRDAILACVRSEPEIETLEPMNAGVSLAGDLGYTYGAYRTARGSSEPAGYFVRIWKKNAAGSWDLVVDKIAPREEK
jgi:hypothetical protein